MAFSLEGHADSSYDAEFNHLHLRMVEMGGLALDQSRLALKSFASNDEAGAQRVLDREAMLDTMQLEADDEIISLISRRGPIARDLRITMAFSKVIADLERIGDEAVRIAQIAANCGIPPRQDYTNAQMHAVVALGKSVLEVLEQSIEAFDTLDARRAESLLQHTRQYEAQLQRRLESLSSQPNQHVDDVKTAVNIALALKALHGLSEHTHHLAEYVIYIVKGVDVRHNP